VGFVCRSCRGTEGVWDLSVDRAEARRVYGICLSITRRRRGCVGFVCRSRGGVEGVWDLSVDRAEARRVYGMENHMRCAPECHRSAVVPLRL
jgi:hypothetical protein